MPKDEEEDDDEEAGIVPVEICLGFARSVSEAGKREPGRHGQKIDHRGESNMSPIACHSSTGEENLAPEDGAGARPRLYFQRQHDLCMPQHIDCGVRRRTRAGLCAGGGVTGLMTSAACSCVFSVMTHELRGDAKQKKSGFSALHPSGPGQSLVAKHFVSC